MSGFYEKRWVCHSCRDKVMKDQYEESAHRQMDHKLEWYTFGGFKKGPPEDKATTGTGLMGKYHEGQQFKRKNVMTKEEMDLGLAEMEEDAIEPEEELGI